jgi:hypothetical protein
MKTPLFSQSSSALLAQAERDRADYERAIAADRDYVQNDPSLERHPSARSGRTYPRIDRNGVVLRSPLGYFGRLEYATASIYRELGYRPPPPHVLAALDADPGYGDPRFPRHMFGYTPPEQRCTIRVSRVEHDQVYGPLEVRKSVSPNELDAAIAEGWARV